MRSKVYQNLDPEKHLKKWYEYKHSEAKLGCFATFTCDDINTSILSSKFLVEIESDFTPAHKKMSKLSKEYCRPISILPDISKVYERCLYDQMSSYFEDIFSKYQCGFRKGYSAQHCLLVMLEKWKKLIMRVSLVRY